MFGKRKTKYIYEGDFNELIFNGKTPDIIKIMNKELAKTGVLWEIENTKITMRKNVEGKTVIRIESQIKDIEEKQ